MTQLENASEKGAIGQMDTLLKRLSKNWSNAKKARKTLDFKTFTQALDTLNQDLENLPELWQGQQTVMREVMQAEQDFVLSENYPVQVQLALRQANIPFKGEYPNYEFPPFRLTFARDSIRLSLGRKSEQTKSFEPTQLADWVSKRYRRVVDSKFDGDRFCKELLMAYEMVNRLSLHQSSVNWGHPVPLKDLYKLLTLRQTAKQEYPEPLFVYDLARLKEQFEIRYEGHLFELMPSREQANTFLLINSQGQESRVGDLVIYEHDKS